MFENVQCVLSNCYSGRWSGWCLGVNGYVCLSYVAVVVVCIRDQQASYHFHHNCCVVMLFLVLVRRNDVRIFTMSSVDAPGDLAV